MTGRVGYVVSRFPLLTETFVLREMLELERRGWDVDLYAIIHEDRQRMHPEARSFDERGHYLRAMSRRTVVFPHPVGPSSTTTSPSSTVRSMPSTAVTPVG